jgi:hypothetical protein
MANTSRIDAEGTSIAETLIKFCNALTPDEQIDYLDALAKAASGILLRDRADEVEGDGDGWKYDTEALEEEATRLLEVTEEAEKWIAEASKRWESQNSACFEVSDAQNIDVPSIAPQSVQTNQDHEAQDEEVQLHNTGETGPTNPDIHSTAGPIVSLRYVGYHPRRCHVCWNES